MSSAGGGSTPTTTPTTPATPTTPTNTPTNTTPTTPQQPTTTTPPPPPVTTSVTTAPTAPTSTQIITSIITASPTQQTSTPPTTVISTISNTATNGQSTSSSGQTTGIPASSTNSAAPASSGLNTAGKTAIAVIIPLAVVALLVFAGIFLWRRRSKKKADEEDRRKEMEAYGYNPNNDPSLPAAVKDDDGLTEDGAGYRGWGPAGTAPTVGRKTSTNASSGRQNFSDASTMYQNPGSPTQGTYNSEEQMSHHHRNGTMDSETMGHMGQMGAAGVAAGGLHRGPSNASSTYSAGARSQTSNDYPIPLHNGQDYYTDNAYYQAGPYDNYGAAGGQPIMRESPARRLTQINESNVQPREGGIARNF